MVGSVVETDIEPPPPDASTVALLGLSEVTGFWECGWLTVNVWPTPPRGVTVMVPVRSLFVLFAPALQPAWPGPIPVEPDITESHGELMLLTAVHCRSGSSVLIVMRPVVPLGLALEDAGLTLRLPAS